MGKRIGPLLVNILQIVELLMMCILVIVVCGDLFTLCLDGFDRRIWMTVTSVILLPTFTSLRYSLYLDIVFLLWNIGIHLNYPAHIFLPLLEGSMVHNWKFGKVLKLTYAASISVNVLFSFIFYLTFGHQTENIFVTNLPTELFKLGISLALIFKAICSYHLPFHTLTSMLECIFFKVNNVESKRKKYCLQFILYLITVLCAVLIPHYTLFMGFISSITGILLSFVLPSYFHIKLRWKKINFATILFDVTIISVTMFCGGIGVYMAWDSLSTIYSEN
ncbi:vesicular inhibitory amino acid transporter-like protein, partial [Leptotrombidium deliense]